MYFITDDCGYDDGKRFATIAEAREARKAVLAEIGQHMSDHVHVADAQTTAIVTEPGAWKVIDPDTNAVTYFDAHNVDKADDLWDKGYLEVQPEWIADYEWGN